jgi:cytochrome c5
MPHLRALGVVVLAGVALQPAAAAGQTETPSRALLDRYCVTCHNERLQTGGVMFDQVDISRPDEHRELLEKVVRKLRSGQMPPEGRPRPDRAAVTAFVTALEAELDGHAESAAVAASPHALTAGTP